VQTSPQAATISRLDAQTLSQALTIAWDLLAAADDPATIGERADETRRAMARNLVRAAQASDSMTDLWLAALNAVVDGNAFKKAG
jgi:queuine/archaeosine tRNA-ribosyltransferase